jgi:hypothetical protein
VDRRGRGASGIGIEGVRAHTDLTADERDHMRCSSAFERKAETGMAQQRELHREGDAIGLAAPRFDQREVARAQNVMPGQLLTCGGNANRPSDAIRVFTDVRSGKSMDRPGLTELLAYAREGGALAVVRLDRPGRSLGELLTVVKELKQRGVALLSLEETLDTSSAAGELVFHVFGAIAHFERWLIAERTKDGIAAARAKGKLPGRRPLDPDKLKSALQLVASGVSPTDAAR